MNSPRLTEAASSFQYACHGNLHFRIIEFARTSHGAGQVVGPNDIGVNSGYGKNGVDGVDGIYMLNHGYDDRVIVQPEPVLLKSRAITLGAGKAHSPPAPRRIVD